MKHFTKKSINLFLIISFVCFGFEANAKIDTIVVSDSVFTPQFITINSGDSVYFQGASAFHPVVSETGDWATFTSSTLISTEISVPGSYPYYCQNHGSPGGVGMSGVITVLPLPDSIFINEIHYDNIGGDVNEGVEIAAPAGTDLSCYELIFYDGADSSLYNTNPVMSLSGIVPDQGCGYGTVWFSKSGLQQGPDAIALYNICDSSVVQFISYEGTIIAKDGPAVGITSTDIGVSESSATLNGESLQLTGIDTVYSGFTWTGPSAGSEGSINCGQSFCLNFAVMAFTVTSQAVNENAGTITIEVSILNPSATDTAKINVVYYSGTATPDSDFYFTDTTLVFPPSSSASQFANITIIDDSIFESSETIVLNLQNPLSGIFGCDTLITLTISGNDIPFGSCLNLFFSEYFEGSSNNKAIEIYNPRPDTVDLSNYSVQIFTNGSSTVSNTLNLTGLLLPGDVYVIRKSSADNINLINEADTTSSVANFNGNDAVALFQFTDTLDIIGEIGVDPGVDGWPVGAGFTKDNTLIRNKTIHQGQLDWSVSVAEWDVYPLDDSIFIGYHINDLCTVNCSSFTLDAGIDDFICPGVSTTLNASVSAGSGSYIFAWNADTTLNDTSIYNPVASPSSDTTDYIVTVIDTLSGCNDTDTVTVFVIPSPVADFTPDVDSGCHPLAVNFTNLSTGSIGCAWDFGDGASIDTSCNPIHVFANILNVDSVYSVCLTAISLGGCTDTICNIITVHPKPVALFNINADTVCSPFIVAITNLSSGTDSCFWDFGDGISIDSTCGPNLLHTYINLSSSPVIYILQLIAKNSDGCSDTFSQAISVYPNITADFNMLPNDTGCHPFTVTFFNSSLGDDTCKWDFGDGSPINTFCNPTHTFTNTSIVGDSCYNVELIAISQYGCSDTSSQIVCVYSNIIVDAGVDTIIDQGETIVLGGSPTATGAGPPFTYLWTPAVGLDNDTTANPNYTPSGLGTICFIVTVTDTNGCSGTDSLCITALDTTVTYLSFVTTALTVPEDTGALSIEISIINPGSTDTVRVDVIYNSGTASPDSDFTFTTQTLVFPPSDTSILSAIITIIDDSLVETIPETVVLMLQNPTNGAQLVDSVFTLTINDNDTLITISLVCEFVITEQTVNEDTGTITIGVRLTMPPFSVSVDVVYFSGTAASGSDFNYTTQTLVFTTICCPIDTVQTVLLTIIDDSIIESSETIVLMLQNLSVGILGDSIHTITITDNDTITGIHQYSIIKNQIIVYPNPANDQIYITFSNIEFSPYTLNIYNVTGQLKVSKFITSDAVIDISDLQSGLYLLNIYNDRHQFTRQVSIIR